MREKLIERNGYLFNVYEDALDQAYVVYEVFEPRTEEHGILMRTTDKRGKTKWWGMLEDDEKSYKLILTQFPHLKRGKVLKMGGRVYQFRKEETKY